MIETRLQRRQFLLAAASTLAAGSLFADENKANNHKICVFTKPLQSLSYDELADRIAEMGFDGIEATIRDSGHIEPKAVPDELPKMVEALKKRKLEVTVMTSSINDPNHALTAKQLQVAASLGIKRYRMKYLRYNRDRPVFYQLKEWRPQMRDLAAMNKSLGMTAIYQNHAGRDFVGAPLWDLLYLLEGIPKEQVGIAYDIRHATVEGGNSWPVTFNAVRPKIDTVYVKDFNWVDRKPKNVPLGKGQVNVPEFFKLLAASKFSGPISLHEEYLDHRKPELVPDHLKAMKRDFATLLDLIRG
ncbi:MAG: hypothetical protein CMJ78_11585 [Planctomycetaceae bacterium]|nr:hypothetical protein [Planctomycetaceae bacterium]